MTGAIGVILARNEAERLRRAIASLRRDGLAALVVANGCTDAAATLARAAGAVVIETPALTGGFGAARAIGLALALQPGADRLFTMDNDYTLGPGSAAVAMQTLDHADAVFGRVVPCAGEFARLPAIVQRHGLAEARRDSLRALIDVVPTACPWNPFPAHGQNPGALIGWRAAAYIAVGGIEPVPCHEDWRMAAALNRHGLRVARP